MPSNASDRRWTWRVAFEPGPHRTQRALRRAAATLLLATAGAATGAVPALTLDCPAQVPAQQPFDCRVSAGAADGAAGSVAVTLPPRLMRVAEPPGWSFDVAARR